MKKFILFTFLIAAFFAFNANAQMPTYSYYTTTWISTADTLTSTTSYLPSSSGFRMYQNGQYWTNIAFGIYADSLADSADVVMEMSSDGTNWFEYTTKVADIDATLAWHNIFLTNLYSPFIRWKITHTAADVVKYQWFLYYGDE